MAYPYTPPEFLQNQSVDDIHRRMMNALPDGIDKSELQIPWDYTRPSAIEKAEFVQFELNETIKIIFPHWADDEWLDLHAQMAGTSPRRAANQASGELTVRAFTNTVVPIGYQFATPANLTPSVIFQTTEEVIFDGEPDDKGMVTATIPIQAIAGGTAGNVPKDTIKLMVKPIAGIVYITNTDPTTGGTEIESNDDLRERILAVIRRGISFVGCDADYVRWAQEVPAVGHVIVDPEWAGPGTVRLIVVDANGVPANLQILTAVYRHIVSPDDRIARLAPIGAMVTVVTPTPVNIDISAMVLLREGENIDTVTERFKANLNAYWLKAAAENTVKYVFVGSTLAETAGIANYAGLLINGGNADKAIALGEFPVTGEVVLND